MVEKRINTLSWNQNAFDEVVRTYDHALEKSNYKHKIKYEINGKRTRRRRCIFYNPPYCQSVRNNIGKSFLSLVDRHFCTDYIYHQIFNRCTVKLSYCCMPNALNIIKASNKKVLQQDRGPSPVPKLCSCNDKTRYPLAGNCLVKNVMYEAQMSTDDHAKIYIGSTDSNFKTRKVV